MYPPSTFASLHEYLATNVLPESEEITPRPVMPSTSDLVLPQHTSPFNEPHAAQYTVTDPWIAYDLPCIPSTKTRGKPRSAAYRSDPYPIFRDSTTFQTPAPRYSSARSHPIQLVPNNYPPQDTLAQVHHPLANSPIAIAPSMLDHNLSTSHRMIRPTVHRPFFPVNSLYEAEADSGRSGTVIDHSFNGRNLSAPAYTPRLTHDNYAFQNATFTATTEGAASSQDSFAHVQPPANDSIAISPGILGLDAFTTKQESTVPPMAHDLPLTPIGHRGHIALPMRRHKAIADDFFQPEMSSGASREHAADDPQSVPIQFHENVGKVAHYLRHVNSKHWNCDCGMRFSNQYNGRRHVRESIPCSRCHKKIGRKGDGTYCRHCKRELECAK